jgi:hypothetical protein
MSWRQTSHHRPVSTAERNLQKERYTTRSGGRVDYLDELKRHQRYWEEYFSKNFSLVRLVPVCTLMASALTATATFTSTAAALSTTSTADGEVLRDPTQ